MSRESAPLFIVYLDESGTPADTECVTVAGFLARAEQWVEFERNWKDALLRYGVSALHMREFAHSRGEFSNWKRDEVRRRSFLAGLINIIKTRVIRSIAHAVLMDDYREVHCEYQLEEFIKPYALAGRTCVAYISRWANSRQIDETQIAYVFEDGALDRGDLVQRLAADGKANFSFVSKSHAALQAADLLAYEHFLANIAINKGVIRDYDQLRYPMRELDGINGKLGEGWGVYRTENLLEFCEEVKIPQRKASP